MVKYTFKDVKALAAEVAHYLKDSDLKCWTDTVDGLKDEFSEIKDEFYRAKEMILEFIGPCVFTFSRERSKDIGLTSLIFYTPVNMMPLYIESALPWEKVVARWRLSILK